MDTVWDDSALIKAFNAAMAKCQDMHGLPFRNRSCMKGSFSGNEGNENIPSSDLTNTLEESCKNAIDDAKAVEELDACGMLKNPEQQDFQQPEISFMEDELKQSSSSLLHSENQLTGKEKDQLHLMQQLQQLEQQKQLLQQQLSQLDNVSQVNGSNTLNAYSSQCNACCCPCYPSNGEFYPYQQCSCISYPGISFPSWLNGSHYQNSAAACNSQERNCFNCGASESAVYQSLSGSSDLLDKLRLAVKETVKVAGHDKFVADSSTVDGKQAEVNSLNSQSDLSDVALAWFLAGVHTSRYLATKKSED